MWPQPPANPPSANWHLHTRRPRTAILQGNLKNPHPRIAWPDIRPRHENPEITPLSWAGAVVTRVSTPRPLVRKLSLARKWCPTRLIRASHVHLVAQRLARDPCRPHAGTHCEPTGIADANLGGATTSRNYSNVNDHSPSWPTQLPNVGLRASTPRTANPHIR